MQFYSVYAPKLLGLNVYPQKSNKITSNLIRGKIREKNKKKVVIQQKKIIRKRRNSKKEVKQRKIRKDKRGIMERKKR